MISDVPRSRIGTRAGATPITLILEDDEDILASLIKLLIARGHRAVGAESLARAREIIAAEAPAIAILDLNLGDGSSEELLRELADGPVATPLILLTASPLGRAIAAKYGAAYVRKPFELDALLATIARLTAADDVNSA